MASWTLIAAALAAAYILSTVYALLRNWRAARASGIPYVFAPVYFPHVLWMLFHPVVLPALRALPSALTYSWLPFIDTPRFWHNGHEPFAALGSDIVLVVTPSKNVLWTCDAEVNHQVFTRQADFPKPVELYQPINAFGPTLAGCEGAEWRLQRKITGRPFNSAQYRQVWSYTVKQATALLELETGPTRQGRVAALNYDLGRLTLAVLNRICFGQEIALPADDAAKEAPPAGHELSYSDASLTVIPQLATLFIWPAWFLSE